MSLSGQPVPGYAASVLIAANPKSGASSGRAKVSALRDLLAGSGFNVEVCESLEAVQQRALSLHGQNCLRCVVAAGGDGTAAAVANLIPVGLPMVILPLGTENLLAKHLGLTSEPKLAAQCVAHGNTRLLDAGLANGRLFLVMLSCGFDAHVVQQVHSARRGHIYKWSYFKPICDAMRTYPYPSIDVKIDTKPGEPEESSIRFSAAWLFAFNLPRYAGNLRFCPQASGVDAQLDLCTFARGGSLRGLAYLFHLWLGRHQRLVDFQHHLGRRFQLSSQGTVPYQVDGDPGGVLPLTVEVLPKRLTLLVPHEVP